MAVKLAEYDPQVTSSLEGRLTGESQFSENARTILEKRYLTRELETDEIIETPDGMLKRVAAYIAFGDSEHDPEWDNKSPEEKVKFLQNTAQEFYEIMANLEFLPNSPTLRGAGRGANLSGCYVLPVEDSRDSIFRETLADAVDIQAFGGGTGFNWSRVRPENDLVESTGGKASGPLSFMECYDVTIGKTIAQGGVRQGANMAILNYNHPDIEAFIKSKMGGDLQNFNISVGITEEFMGLVEQDQTYPLINPRDGKPIREVKAREIYDMITHSAWATGDPGVIYLDRINRDNPTPHLGEIESTNPCGEQPLLPYESCNLGSINLARFVIYDTEENPTMDFERLERTVDRAVHFLDNVIGMNNYPIEKIIEMTKGNRKIGLGVMGLADVFIMHNVGYDTQEARDLAENIMEVINKRAKQTSVRLADQRGVFPNFEESIYDTGNSEDRVRNATRTTIAPTGTLSTLASCSGGIEPIFAVAYKRSSVFNKEGDPEVELAVFDPNFRRIANERGFPDSLLEEIAEKGTVQGNSKVPEDLQRIFLGAHDISPEAHLEMQAAIQRWVDNAVSKTVNFSNEATEEDIARVYELSNTLRGIKGVTVFRNECLGNQVLTYGKGKEEEDVLKTLEHAVQEGALRGRDDSDVDRLHGTTYDLRTGCGTVFVTINDDEFGPVEVFVNMNPSGGCADAQTASTGVSLSLGLHANVDPMKYVKHLKSIRCPENNPLTGSMSCPEAVATAVLTHLIATERYTPNDIQNDEKGKKETRRITGMPMTQEKRAHEVDMMCPDCQSFLVPSQGCWECPGERCGYSKC